MITAPYRIEGPFWALNRPEGVVVLLHWPEGEPDLHAFSHFGTPVQPGPWCSAVCSASQAGEGNLRWYSAMEFHGMPGFEGGAVKAAELMKLEKQQAEADAEAAQLAKAEEEAQAKAADEAKAEEEAKRIAEEQASLVSAAETLQPAAQAEADSEAQEDDAAEPQWDGRPPTLEAVIASGYEPAAAAQIVAEEEAKFQAGLPPYDVPQTVGATPPPAADEAAS